MSSDLVPQIWLECALRKRAALESRPSLLRQSSRRQSTPERDCRKPRETPSPQRNRRPGSVKSSLTAIVPSAPALASRHPRAASGCRPSVPWETHCQFRQERKQKPPNGRILNAPPPHPPTKRLMSADWRVRGSRILNSPPAPQDRRAPIGRQPLLKTEWINALIPAPFEVDSLFLVLRLGRCVLRHARFACGS